MIKRVSLILLALVLALSMALIACGGAPAEQEEEEEEEEPQVVRIGFLAPLSGPAVMWGLPSWNVAQLWAEEINDAGGINVDGQIYEVELIAYDDQFLPSEAQKGAEKLILEDEVSVIASPLFLEPTFDVITDNNVLAFDMFGTNLGDDRPNIMTITCNCLDYWVASLVYMHETWPEVQTIAHVTQDDKLGADARFWSEIICDTLGIETVYDSPFALDTTDFAALTTAILASNPDAVDFSNTYPYFSAMITEQLYLQGFDGPVIASSWDMQLALSKVDPEWADGRLLNHWIDPDNSALPEAVQAWGVEYMETYGRDQYQPVAYVTWDQLTAWKWSVEQCGSVDPADVLAFMRAAPVIPTASTDLEWWAEELTGIKAMLSPQLWRLGMVTDGATEQVALVDHFEWWDENQDYILQRVEEAEWGRWERT